MSDRPTLVMRGPEWLRQRQLADAREALAQAETAFDAALRTLRLADLAVARAEAALR